MIACNNVVNAAFMVAGAGCAAALAAVGVSAPRVLVILSGANLAASIWIVRIIPQDTLRALLRWYFLNFHDAEITGLENAAAAGDRTVVVANHLSFLDGAFIAAFLPGYPGVRDRYRPGAAALVPQIPHRALSGRSDEPDVDQVDGQGRSRRAPPRHLPRRAPDPDRRADEDL